MILREIFHQSERQSDKWEPYFEIYEKHLSKFRGTNATIVEVGVQAGGSLEMWSKYFGTDATIIGIDIDPECLKLNYTQKNIQVVIGNQTNRDFWGQFFFGNKVDVLIDDGGHTMEQQVLTFENVFPRMSMGGVYICEDCHTSYMGSFNAGVQQPQTFIEYAKSYVDVLNSSWLEASQPELDRRIDLVNNGLSSVSFYDSMTVFEKLGKRSMNRVFAK